MSSGSSLAKKVRRVNELADLRRKIRELEAQLPHVPYSASQALDRASTSNLRGSAVLVQLTFLGGKDVCPVFAVKDGLSADTIAALREDLRRTYSLTSDLKP